LYRRSFLPVQTGPGGATNVRLCSSSQCDRWLRDVAQEQQRTVQANVALDCPGGFDRTELLMLRLLSLPLRSHILPGKHGGRHDRTSLLSQFQWGSVVLGSGTRGGPDVRPTSAEPCIRWAIIADGARGVSIRRSWSSA